MEFVIWLLSTLGLGAICWLMWNEYRAERQREAERNLERAARYGGKALDTPNPRFPARW